MCRKPFGDLLDRWQGVTVVMVQSIWPIGSVPTSIKLQRMVGKLWRLDVFQRLSRIILGSTATGCRAASARGAEAEAANLDACVVLTAEVKIPKGPGHLVVRGEWAPLTARKAPNTPTQQ